MKIKKIGLAALSLSAFLALAACGNNANPTSGNTSGSNIPTTTTTQAAPTTTTATATQTTTVEYPEIIVDGKDSEYKEVYSSSSINTENVKKVFYLGDVFNSNGLVVSKNYLTYDKDNKRVDVPIKSYPTDDFSVDSSEVDIEHVGKYPVYVRTRVGTKIDVRTYQIEVKSSLFESTPDIEFISGLDVAFTDGDRFKEYTLGDEIDLSPSDITVSVHQKTVSHELNINDQIINYDPTKISIDMEIDNQKVGSQMIKVTYDGGIININGTNYENKVTSYVLVNVKNDPLSIEPVDTNIDEFEATLEDLDFSQWKIKINREVGSEIVDFSDEIFVVEDLDPFIWGRTQTITVKLRENQNIKYNSTIYIEESADAYVEKYNDLTQGTLDEETNELPLADTDFIFGSKKCTYVNERTQDYYGSMHFASRIDMKGSEQYVRIVMDKPGQIAVFFASKADEERDITLLNSDKEEVETATTSSVKQEITKHIFNIDTAGTYYIINPSGGIYVHGFVIAKTK